MSRSHEPTSAARAVPKAAPRTIIQAIDDPRLFKPMFDAPSWRPWRVFLKVLQGLPMGDDEFAVYRHHTARQSPPAAPARYAQLVVGRRGGKSRILALLAAYIAAIPDHSAYLVPGETGVVAVLAADRQQAKVILNYITGFLREIPLLKDIIVDELAETVRLNNRVTIEVHTASIASPRGRTFLAVLCDEIAFWPTGDSQNPDVEVINAVRPSLSTIPYSLLLLASSPYARKGVLYTNYSRYFGKDDAPCLVWQGSTVEMNSTLADDPLIAEMALEDPERAASEHGAQFRTDIAAFITREAVEDVVARGVRELPPGGGISYSAFVDPSGGSADSMTLAIGHLEGEIGVLDCVREHKPPFSPDSVVEELAGLLKTYGISRVTGDAYAGLWPRERFAAHGILYDVSQKNKSAIYSEFLPALNGRRVRLLDNPRLVGQLCNLERRTARGGRDSIDHASGAHDDVSNAACGALVQVIADRRPSLVKKTDLLVGVAPLPLPSGCKCVIAVLCIGKNGDMAVVYSAKTFSGPELLILDFDGGPIHGRLFADVQNRACELSDQCRARGRIIFVAPGLMRHAAECGVETAEIPDHLKPEELLLSATTHTSRGAVKLCAPALEKSRTQPFSGALDFKGGEDADSALRQAAILTIALALDAA
jgi:hypothetical protein